MTQSPTEHMSDAYDLVVLGAGPAGESAAELAAFFGHRSVIVERDRPGGVVTTTGGVPTKTLREAALSFSGLRDGDRLGVRSGAPPSVEIDAIRTRTRDVCDLLQQATAENIAAQGVDYLRGTGRLEGAGRVVVRDERGRERTLQARVVMIATGSRPRRPDGVPFDLPGVCDTDTILQRGRVPADILIVGGGPVGVEFVTICRALGAHVTLVDRSTRLLASMDGELADRLTRLLVESGVNVRGGVTVDAVTEAPTGPCVRLSDGTELTPDTVLFAAGRVSNTEGLGLAEAAVQCDARGRIAVDAKFRTSASGVWAAGDVLGPTLASIAMEQGRAAVCDAFGIPFEGNVDPVPVSAVYGMPELAGAGVTEEACRERGLEFEVGRCELSRTPRGAIAGRGGLLKLVFDRRDRRLLGVHCLGDIASEIVGIGQMAMRLGGTLTTIATMSMSTPTYSYAYKYAAMDGLRRLAARRPTAAPSIASPGGTTV